MKKNLILTFASVFLPLTSFANAELVQIVSLAWDESTQKLTPFSFGSGTAIAKDLVITNKHVVKVGTQTADFLLLCPGQVRETKAVQCDVAAGVSALHPTMDLALVKTLNPEDFLLSTRPSSSIRSKDDVIRIVGFPVPDDSSAQNFGGTKTLEAFEAWQKNPELGLDFKGDTPTTTRGKVLARFLLENTGEFYTQTDALVNFGNSGGAAFDQFGDYIGIPTLKDSLGRSYILEYAQMDTWVKANSGDVARIEEAAYTYYKKLTTPTSEKNSQPGVSVSDRLKIFQAQRRQNEVNEAVTESCPRLCQHLKALAAKRSERGGANDRTTPRSR